MSTKFKLGQRVKAWEYWYKSKGGMRTKWIRTDWHAAKLGIVIGKRNVAEGYTTYYSDEGHTFYPTRHLSLYLVATNLSTAYHVAEEDMEALE